ncbi:MAG: phosphoglucosamine mutase [Akkermansiaceae bacterium]
MSNQLFGTDGIRGIANQWPITAEVALRVGRAVASVLPAMHDGSHKVLIGRDTRISGTMLELAITSGLVSEGSDVILAGVVPTPAIAYLTQKMNCDAGIMLTASHNPFQDNGIKIFGADGFKLSDEQEKAVEQAILAEILIEPQGELGLVEHLYNAAEQYSDFAQKAVENKSLEGLKIVLDCANGAAHHVAPIIFQSLGAEVISLSTLPDGQNINLDCGALHPQKAAAVVREAGADIGVCFDGDADRVIFCDESGKVIDGDSMLCLCAKALKAEGKLKNDTLVATVMSNLGMRDSLAADGIALETTGVGDRLVLERMREKGYNFGGENSGHIIYADHATTGDGIVSALMVLRLMKEKSAPLSQLADCMELYPQVLLALAVSDKPPISAVPELVAAIKSAELAFAENGRVLVRYSGTEKKIRILAECSDATLAQEHANFMAEAVRSSIGA